MSLPSSVASVQSRIAALEASFPARGSTAVRGRGAEFASVLSSVSAAQAGSAPGSAPVNGAAASWPGAGSQFDDLFRAAGAKHGVDPALLAAVAKAESNFNPRAKSHAGALGLMQIMPGTARGLGVDPLDPVQAVDGAARLLSGHLEKFGSIELALAAYNAGPGAVTRHGGIPPYRETQNYVAKIMTDLRS